MSQIVPQRDGFREVLVEGKSAGDGTGNLRNVQRVGQPRDVVIPLGRKKYLRFVFQAFEGVAVDETVAVALKIRTEFARRFLSRAAFRLVRLLGLGRKKTRFYLIGLLLDRDRRGLIRHFVSSFFL